MNIKEYFTSVRTSNKIIIIIYFISFLGAFGIHFIDIIRGGLFPYQNWNPDVPLYLNIYWTSLTVFELLAIIFLAINIKVGLWFYFVIIVSDVLLNVSFTITNYGISACINFAIICQFSFMLFLLITIRSIMRIVTIYDSGTTYSISK